jgi:hypothetical protein
MECCDAYVERLGRIRPVDGERAFAVALERPVVEA